MFASEEIPDDVLESVKGKKDEAGKLMNVGWFVAKAIELGEGCYYGYAAVVGDSPKPLLFLHSLNREGNSDETES